VISASVLFCGLLFAPDAEVVDVVNVTPLDLEPLKALPKLRELRVGWTNPHRTPGSLPLDLDALAGLARLEVVVLPRMPVHDLGPLRALHGLRVLDVAETEISDLAPLAGAAHLRTLDVAYTRVADLAPLAALVALEVVNLAGTRVHDLTPLHGLHALRRVDLTKVAVAPAEVAALRTAIPGVEIVGVPPAPKARARRPAK
jgi:Leucine-rich repeat (LRR) protein